MSNTNDDDLDFNRLGGFSVMDTGLTLRDWFACQALAANADDAAMSCEEVAKLSYELADAMLKARNMGDKP